MNRTGTLAMLVVLCALPALGQTTEPSTEQIMEPSTADLAASDNGFALDLYGQLRGKEGNLFFSPYSIDVALRMVRAGAAGDTKQEITRTLKLADLKPEEMAAASAALSERFSATAVSRGYDLHVANALWGEVGVPFLPGYLNLLKRDFAADLNLVDFRHPHEAAGTINDWVAAKTNNRITNLISPGSDQCFNPDDFDQCDLFQGELEPAV